MVCITGAGYVWGCVYGCVKFPCIYIYITDSDFLGVWGVVFLKNGVKSKIIKSDSININSIDKKLNYI